MKNKYHHKNENSLLKPITMEEATDLTRCKLIYEFHSLYDENDNIIGKSMIFMESDKPEEEAQKWSLCMFDDGRMMIKKW